MASILTKKCRGLNHPTTYNGGCEKVNVGYRLCKSPSFPKQSEFSHGVYSITQKIGTMSKIQFLLANPDNYPKSLYDAKKHI